MQSIKETASNVAASAKSGMEKTKATVQEKVERMTAHNPAEKEMATERKEARIQNAELGKQVVLEHNAASRAGGTYSHSATGMTGQSTGAHQMSALPGHGTGGPAGAHVTEGTIKSHPIGTATGKDGRPTTAHNTHAGGGTGTGYTGAGYSG